MCERIYILGGLGYCYRCIPPRELFSVPVIADVSDAAVVVDGVVVAAAPLHLRCRRHHQHHRHHRRHSFNHYSFFFLAHLFFFIDAVVASRMAFARTIVVVVGATARTAEAATAIDAAIVAAIVAIAIAITVD